MDAVEVLLPDGNVTSMPYRQAVSLISRGRAEWAPEKPKRKKTPAGGDAPPVNRGPASGSDDDLIGVPDSTRKGDAVEKTEKKPSPSDE